MRKLRREGCCSRCGQCCAGCLNLAFPNICTVWASLPEGYGCKPWPTHPFERLPGCSYRFVDAETGEEVAGYKNQAVLEMYAHAEVGGRWL